MVSSEKRSHVLGFRDTNECGAIPTRSAIKAIRWLTMQFSLGCIPLLTFYFSPNRKVKVVAHHHHNHNHKHYGVGRGLFDFFMVIITGGLWLLWMVVRYLRANS